MTTDRQERLLAMGEMAGVLAHEIRNPLASIKLYAGLLKHGEHDTEIIHGILESIAYAEHVLNNSLSFSRDIKIKKSKSDFNKSILKPVLNNYLAKFDKDGIEFEYNGDEEVIAFVDIFYMKQVMHNLVENAYAGIKERINTGEDFKPKLKISLQTADNKIDLSIKDNGIGIDNDKLERIFDPFFTTKSQGTGLGPSIVQSIIFAHSATIHIESVSKEETAVYISL